MLETVLILIPVIALGSITPGPDILYILSKTVGQSLFAGLCAALGIATGLIFHVTAVSFGLAQLFQYTPSLFLAVKFLGALYLLYLAWCVLKADVEAVKLKTNKKADLLKIFRQGFLINVLNPKVMLFFAAIVPQFVDLSNLSGNFMDFLMVLVTILLSGFLAQMTLAFVTYKASNLVVLNVNNKWRKIQNYSLAGLFSFFAVKLIRES